MPLSKRKLRQFTTHLASYETIKRFALLPDDFTFDSGSLTFTMKLKRRVVEKQYHDLIDKLFSDVFEPRSVTRGSCRHRASVFSRRAKPTTRNDDGNCLSLNR